MRLICTTLLASLACAALVAGCSDNGGTDDEPFDTFQACFDDHHNTGPDSFTADKAIEICCIDHPIGGAAKNTVCGDTTQTCVTYVTAQLSASSATTTDIDTACTAYPTDRGG